MLIRSIQLRNLLSYGPDTPSLSLGPLNIFIGPNGSGKSNLIESFSLLQSVQKGFSFPIREGGGIHDWLWKGTGNAPVACVEAVIEYPTVPDMPLRYRFDFTQSGQRFEIVDERIENESPFPGHGDTYFFYRYEHNHPVLNVREKGGIISKRYLKREDVDPEKSIIAQRIDPDQYPEITWLGDTLPKIRIYREWSFGRYTLPRMPQKSDLPNDFLEEDGRNLGLVLNRLQREPARMKLLETIRALYDGIEDIHVTVDSGSVQVFFLENGFSVPATRLSDGTLRFLCLAAILIHPSPPPLVCIEEPELGLHPDLIGTVADLLKDASRRTQLIVTTHSDILVDAFTEDPGAVLICEKQDGCTSIRRLDAESLAPWIEKYRLGNLWIRGEIGGTRW